MEDKKDKVVKEASTRDMEGLAVTPPVDGLRRSSRLRNLPPPPPPQAKSEVGGSSARKRPSPPEQENGAVRRKPTDEDEVRAQVNVVKREGTEQTEVQTDKMLQVQKRSAEPIFRKNGQTADAPTVEVEGVTAKRGEAPASSSSSSGNPAGSSGIQSSQEVDAHPCLCTDNVILDEIFKHIIRQPETGHYRDVWKDVRNIRQVCKTWRTSITRLYRQTGPIATFDDYSHVNNGTLTKFLDTMRPSKMIPVQSYKFFVGSLLGPNGEPELFREFLVKRGPEAVSLDIKIRSTESEEIMLNLVDLPELNLAKLTRLKLTIYENHQVTFQANRIPGNVKLVELLLIAAKNLREFELSYPPLRHDDMPIRDQEETLIQQLVPVITKRLPASVKRLFLKVEMGESGFDGLAGIQSKLRGFDIKVPSRMKSKPICKFLQSQAATLQHFQLLGHPINETFVGFPILHELVQLEMGYGYDVSIATPFEFAEIFPKLQRLKMWSAPEEPFLAQKPLRSLRLLHLASLMKSIEPGFFKGISKSFPCLAELHFETYRAPKEVMGELFTYFDNLESLSITDFYSPPGLESVFSGIAESECSRIDAARRFEKENMNELQRGPSLLNLTKLRKLVVGSGELRFTDFTAHFVFLEMESLRELHLPKGNVKFSPKYRDRLEVKLDKLVLE